MTRRVVFTAIASLALVVGLIPVGSLVVTAAARASAAHPTGYPSSQASVPASRAASAPAADPSTSGPVSPSSPADPSAPGMAASSGTLPLAERLRHLEPGDQLVTVQQLRDFLNEYKAPATAKVARDEVAEMSIEIRCMSDAGYYWDPREADVERTDPSASAAPVGPAARLALDGRAGTPYRWQDAGCRGLAFHETGQD